MNKDLKFTGFFVIINDSHISIDKFREKFPEQTHHYRHSGSIYILNPHYEDNLLYIPINGGSVYPLPQEVIHAETFEKSPNPRSKDFVEPKQDFAIIDFSTGYLWISNIYRKILLWTYFVEIFKTTSITIKEAINESDFIGAIKSVNNIKMSVVPGLFSHTGVLSDELGKEIYGYGATTAVLEFKYKEKMVGDDLKTKITSLIRNRDAYRDVTISGKDANGATMLFNPDAVLRKINVRAKMNNNGTFNEKDVWEKVKKELKKI